MPQENFFFGKDCPMSKILEEIITQEKFFNGQEMSPIKVKDFVLFASFIALCPCPRSRVASAQMF